MKTLQKSLISTQLLTSLSSTLKNPKKRFPIDTEDPQYLAKSHFFMALLMHLFIQTLELLNETYFLTW